MATVLKNVIAFTGLVVGVPTARAHGLNINGISVAPDFVIPATNGYTITASATQITVTRDSVDAEEDLNVFCERWHSIERVLPLPGQLTGLIPFIAIGGGAGGGGGGTVTGFDYTVTGAEPDLANIVIAIPGAPLATDEYIATVTQGGADADDFLGPKVVTATQTDSQFVLSLTSEAEAGYVFNFLLFIPS